MLDILFDIAFISFLPFVTAVLTTTRSFTMKFTQIITSILIGALAAASPATTLPIKEIRSNLKSIHLIGLLAS